MNEIEQIVLGQMLLNIDCAAKGKELLTTDSFQGKMEKDCFQAMANLDKVDLITASEAMKTNYTYQEAALFTADCTNHVGTYVHFEYHCKLLIEQEIKTRLQKETGKIAMSDEDVFELIKDNSELLQDIILRINRLKNKSLSEVWDDNESQIALLKAGYIDLDNLCKFNIGNLVIIAARTSMGKTWFMLNLAANNPQSSVFSLEMTTSEIAGRLKQLGVTKETELKVYDNIISLTGIIAQMEQDVIAGIKIFFIDLIGQVESKGDYREQEISNITKALKQFAKRTGSIVFAVSQLNREVEKRGSKKPMLSDLRESGAIEQDADIVLMLYRPEYYNEETFKFFGQERSDVENTLMVICNKNRHGKSGEIILKGGTKLFDDIKFNDNPNYYESDKIPF